jgi:chemotaxis protein methyltransferase CheR
MPLSLSPQVFAILRALIEDHAGIQYRDGDRDLLADRASTRAQEAGFDSLLDYYYYLRYDPRGGAELDTLVEHLVVQETYLFREVDQLRALVNQVIAPQIAQGGRLRIWSAACATGEEPVSVAIMLAERGLLDQVEIVATDISQRALERARTGRYTGRSLRAIGPDTRFPTWLEPDDAGALRADPRVVSKIAWSRLNLLDDAAIAALGTFDVILCRNVLIYFSDPTTTAVVDRLTDALAPGGTLLVSVTESLLRFGTYLHCEERDGVFFYRKLRSAS